MGLELVTTGDDPPNEINVVIEIPKDSEPVKYEVDKASGAIFVDRICSLDANPCNKVRAATALRRGDRRSAGGAPRREPGSVSVPPVA